MPNVEEILDRLYASEIHFSLRWVWDAGMECSLGDEPVGGPPHRSSLAAVSEAADAAEAKYPESAFAKWWRKAKPTKEV